MVRTNRNPTRRMSLADIEPPPRAKRPESLTSREQGILELIWAGFKNKEIGQKLKISVKTVEAHRANMMKKLRVSNTAQLLKTASKTPAGNVGDMSEQIARDTGGFVATIAPGDNITTTFRRVLEQFEEALATLLRLAAQLERVAPWYDRRPTLG